MGGVTEPEGSRDLQGGGGESSGPSAPAMQASLWDLEHAWLGPASGLCTCSSLTWNILPQIWHMHACFPFSHV